MKTEQRRGVTCMACLTADHRRCHGLSTDPCSCEICGKPGVMKFEATRRPKTRYTRTQDPRMAAGGHAVAAKRKPGPKPWTEAEKDEVARMVGMLVADCASWMHGPDQDV